MITQQTVGIGTELSSHITEWKKMKSLARFLKDESGATAIEYGLIASGIAVVIIVVVQLVGTNLEAVFQKVADNLKAA
jgi:pilus assembly protein Flp/PilA